MPANPVLSQKEATVSQKELALPEPTVTAPTYLALKVNPDTVVRVLFGIIFLLVAQHLLLQYTRLETGLYLFYFGIPWKFNLDLEQTVPAYFSSMLLLLAACLFLVVALGKRREKNKYLLHWVGLAIVFLCLSVDEVVSFHEMMTEQLASGYSVFSNLHYAWALFGLFVVLAFSFLYARFFFSLSRKYKIQFSLAAACFIGGALGIEFFGGKVASVVGYEHMAYITISALEEAFEMIGIVLLIRALFAYIKQYVPVRLYIG